MAWLAAAMLLVCGPALAVEEQPGNPPLQFYGPRDYAAGPLNWSILQDRRGLIYAANADGVLEYDGVGWRLIRTDRQTRARALAMDAAGRIYVGAQGEFGYLAADGQGQMAFVSLSAQLPEAERDFSDIWMIHTLDSGVYFRSQRRLFRLHGGHLSSWSVKDVGYSANLGERLLLFDRVDGLLELHDGQFRVLPGSDPAALGDVQAILPWQDDGQIRLPADGLLLGSKQKGLLVWRNGTLQPLEHPANRLLIRDGLRGGRLLPNGSVVLLTLAEGPMLLDSQGRVQRRLGRAEGVAGDRAFEVTVDRHGDLWLALDTGIARVAAFDPLSRFDESELGGSVLVALRLGERLYVGSNTRLTWLRASAEDVERIGVTGHVRHLIDFEGRLLTAGNGGVFELYAERTRSLRTHSASELRRSRTAADRVWVAERDGLASLRWQDGDWRDEGKRLITTSVVRSMAEDAQGDLWLGTDLDGVLYLPGTGSIGPGHIAPDQVRKFGTAAGLPSAEENQVFELQGDVLVRSRDGIYRFDAASARFQPDPRFHRLFPGRPGWQLSPRGGLAVDSQGWIWLQAHEAQSNDTELGALVPQADGRYAWQAEKLLALRGLNVTGIYAEGERLLWFGTNEGLFRFDRSIERARELPFDTLLRRVSHGDGRLRFGGSGAPAHAAAAAPLAYADNHLLIEFSAPSFVEPRANRFQTWLEGYEDDWSPWSAASHREFTNLAPGEYRFRVRARNIHDQIGNEASYSFELLAPWYRTWPAYLVYTLATILLAWAALRWRVSLLERDKALLARHVAERTEELRQARDIAEQQRLAAEQATRSKSEFLASMSHEIRTPMNAIIGFSHLGRQLPLPAAAQDYFAKIAGAGEALLGIVNDILDFSKIEAGKLELERTEFELGELLRKVEDLFVHQAEAKGIELVLSVAANVPPRLVGDPLRLAQVLINLSNNALKFTERGQVLLRVEHLQDLGEQVRLRFAVKDSGIGIAPAQLESLFQAFAQAEAGTARRYGGTGLGLAISQRLVQLMGGSFEVDSTPGVGSEFAFSANFQRLPQAGRPGNLHERLGALRVLVVDDNAIVRDALQQQLETFGLPVATVASAEAAYAALDQARLDGQPFGLVLLDWQMPGVDGLQAGARILANPTDPAPVAVIMVTAHGGDELRQKARDVGMRGVLTKPVSPSLLFNVLLQACDALAVPAIGSRPSTAPAAIPPQLAGTQVLVVEDNPINQQVAREILQLAGIVVTIADSGEAALQQVRAQRFDAVLMDVHMPGMDGLEATRRIRALNLPHALPIIAMTADAMHGYRDTCLAAGMDDALSKPVETPRLFATLAHWLGHAPAPAAIDDQASPPPVLRVLDSQRAITRLGGNKALYLRLLGDVLREWRDLPARLDAFLASQDHEQAARLAHSFKGVAGHVGAAVAEAAAGRVDLCLRRGELGALPEAVEALRRSHTDALREAEAMRPPTTPKLPPSSPGLRIDVDALLTELLQRVQRFDPSAEALLPMLRTALGASPPPALAALESQLGNYDFKTARSTLEAWLGEAG